jgi:hypothetical protein
MKFRYINKDGSIPADRYAITRWFDPEHPTQAPKKVLARARPKRAAVDKAMRLYNWTGFLYVVIKVGRWADTGHEWFEWVWPTKKDLRR